jgi:hypothetical protein
MKFQAQITFPGHGFATRTVGPWRRTYPAALADARSDIDPMKARIATWEIIDSRGNTREISETQWSRGIDEYHEAIAMRDAVGVWG